MVTITDIAREIGVTPSTVSRALNGRKGVSSKLRNKIAVCCKNSGYEPNGMARALITKKSGIIGLIIPDIMSPYYSCIAKGVGDFLEKQGKNLLLCSCSRNAETEKNYISMLKRQQAEGVVIVSVTAKAEFVESLVDAGMKIVAADSIISRKCACVVNDNYTGAMDLFCHMLRCGCRRIGWIGGNPDAYTTKERLRAFEDALSRFGRNVLAQDLLFADSTFKNGYELTEKLLDNGVDAIFGINDSVALGVVKYCMDHGVAIPGDLKVAGYDDLEISGMISVPLTTVHQRKVLLGYKAAELLLSQIRDGPNSHPEKIVLEPSLVVRKSCGEKQAMLNFD